MFVLATGILKRIQKLLGILGGCKKDVNLGILKRIQKVVGIARKLKSL